MGEGSPQVSHLPGIVLLKGCEVNGEKRGRPWGAGPWQLSTWENFTSLGISLRPTRRQVNAGGSKNICFWRARNGLCGYRILKHLR